MIARQRFYLLNPFGLLIVSAYGVIVKETRSRVASEK